MQKILYIITQSEMGGAQRYIFDLATNLPKSQYEVHVAAGGDGILFKNLEHKGVSTHALPHLKRSINPLSDHKARTEIASLIKTLHPDIVHLNSSKAGVLGSKAAKRAGVKKIVYTAHGFVFNEPLPAYLKKAYIKLERDSAVRVSRIITVSEYDKKTGIAAGIPEEKMTVIHNGVDRNAMHFLDREEARLSLFGSSNTNTRHSFHNSSVIIGAVANCYHTKGLDVLIRAMDSINERLVIIGDGPKRSELEKLARKHGHGHIHFMGSLDNASRFLKAFNLFALPSRKEGLPYTLLEAQAAELPIVATTVGGVPEMINNGENGYLVSPDDSNALTEAIQQALKHPLPSSLDDEYTLRTMLAKTIAVYEE